MAETTAIEKVCDAQVMQSDVLERAQIDMQVSTAKRFPRDVALAIKRIETLATLDRETAEACFYSLPRDGKAITGPSARLAEIVAASWGNLRAEAVIVRTDADKITSRGMAWDLESNYAASVEVSRRITNKAGRRFSDDMVIVTGNAAGSIAFRNAIFKVVPAAVMKDVFARIRSVSLGDERTLKDRLGAMLAWYEKQGMTRKHVLTMVGRSDVEAVTLEDLQLLRETATAIKEESTTVAELIAAQTATPNPAHTPGRQSFRKPAAPEAAQAQAAEPEAAPQEAAREPEPPTTAPGFGPDDKAAFVDRIQNALAAGNDAVNRSIQKAMARADVTEMERLHVNTLADIAASI